jgi:hypothetical protein
MLANARVGSLHPRGPPHAEAHHGQQGGQCLPSGGACHPDQLAQLPVALAALGLALAPVQTGVRRVQGRNGARIGAAIEQHRQQRAALLAGVLPMVTFRQWVGEGGRSVSGADDGLPEQPQWLALLQLPRVLGAAPQFGEGEPRQIGR